ncbi:MAG: 16S rRNA (guanine(966)-N(2))-methyltransferase RsmD [Hamadaea sp.]|nr:16S rRNA (guanine(966)-N(2))-methyltransferase RsmD [Hamadaea sp.]NUR48029.1 16S rRNA (guanine(966)-N(2))-methyltransferase RsmD [Hamadaea sp.]NUT06742.1 16S rRNA (guanine(966)-N(2))-methyltransferase RsmD [Hamadaea sp.]
MTRIVAGVYGGRRLTTLSGPQTRPTADRVREALFSSLSSEHGGDLDGLRFADLYAGSGAIGLEAVSRGAAYALLVESDPKAARVIRANITALGAGASAELLTVKVSAAVAGPPPGGPFDVVFADPPYAVGEDDLKTVLDGLAGHGWLAEDALVVIERARRSPEPPWVHHITGERSRRYGETTLWYGRADPGVNPAAEGMAQ